MKYLKPFNESLEDKEAKYVKGQIPESVLSEYIDDCWMSFRGEEFTGNGIHATLLRLKESEPGTQDYIKYNDMMLMWLENQLAREGRILCDNCQGVMQMYYTAKCFNCDKYKPKVEDGEGNLLMAMKFLDNREPDFNYKDFWNEVLQRLEIRNDTYTSMYKWDSINNDLFFTHYPNADKHKWMVSW